jgi:hypothetical protein
MTIERIVGRFLEIEGSAAGCGPRHQTQPQEAMGARISSFLNAYPLLCHDPCYRDFLEIYAGASINQRIDAGTTAGLSGKNSVNILGFSDVSLDIEELEGPVVDDGFLIFAMCGYRRHVKQYFYFYEHDFAFDVSGIRRPGVYRYVSEPGQESSSFSWYIGDFCSWLEDLIDRRGVYERPPSA